MRNNIAVAHPLTSLPVEAVFHQRLAQLFQTTSADEPNGSCGKPHAPGYFGLRQRRLFKEQ